MKMDSATIDRIVAGVLDQLVAGGDGVPREVTTETRRHGGDAEREPLSTKVVTAEVLISSAKARSQVLVTEKAIVTPAAWDAAKERGVEIIRASGSRNIPQRSKQGDNDHSADTAQSPLMIVVRHTEAVDRLWADLGETWRRELLGCPDEAAALATSALCRAEAPAAVILAEETYRAACLANRNERIRAVAIRDASDVRTIKQQLRANVWCLDPTDRSWFELQTILRTIIKPDTRIPNA